MHAYVGPRGGNGRFRLIHRDQDLLFLTWGPFLRAIDLRGDVIDLRQVEGRPL